LPERPPRFRIRFRSPEPDIGEEVIVEILECAPLFPPTHPLAEHGGDPGDRSHGFFVAHPDLHRWSAS
jgi:hypothetical protein